MATTAGTTFPIKPAAYGWGPRSQAAHPELMLALSASETIRAGDAIIYDQSADDGFINGNAGTGVIVGFAMVKTSDTTYSATAGADEIGVCPCLQGQFFVGSIIVAGPGDATGARATDINVGLASTAYFDFLESTEEFLCIANDATSDDMCMTMAYAPTQRDGTSGFNSGVGIVNPRVIFLVNPTLTVYGGTALAS